MPRLFTLILAMLVFSHVTAAPGIADPPSTQISPQPRSQIISGDQWLDQRGIPIQAHGGAILHRGDTYYWFGEYRPQNNPGHLQYVSCYSSTDLLNWNFRRCVVALADPEKLGPRWKLERPKVFYNARTKLYVMYSHIDGLGNGYSYAHVAVFTSNTPDGVYQYVHSFRPLGLESRDIGQFVDDDGSAYLIFESRPTHGFFIAALSDDYLTVSRKVCFIDAPLEGGALAHYKNLYYVVGSEMTGWKPNPNKYATATSLQGPWSPFKDIAPPATNTYGSQSSFILKIVGSQTTTLIFCADQWRPKTLRDSRYLWMPLQIDNTSLQLPKPQPWSIDIATGVVVLK